MKYKKWWLPAVFMVISAVLLICSIFVLPNLSKDDTGYGGLAYGLLGIGVWFFLPLPILSFVYTRSVLENGKGNFWMTLYYSVVMMFPIIIMTNWSSKYVLPIFFIIFIWCEMWALVGLSGKEANKRAAVWYVPAFLFVASSALYLWVDLFWIGLCSVDDADIAYPILTYFVNTVALFIYSRACIKERKHRVPYTIYSALLMTVTPYINTIIDGKIKGMDSFWSVLRLILNIVITFALYEIAALLGAGYKIKIKLPKRKKKVEKKNTEKDTPETEEDN